MKLQIQCNMDVVKMNSKKSGYSKRLGMTEIQFKVKVDAE